MKQKEKVREKFSEFETNGQITLEAKMAGLEQERIDLTKKEIVLKEKVKDLKEEIKLVDECLLACIKEQES